ncbi:MAG: hypothetical protein B1H06_02475 [Candidatus Cloacimonas sp. 4484_143]|nr:MAG: hypothetical protein B1H06_02475 [Candidatus Cloacimonas sp. 4484_143]
MMKKILFLIYISILLVSCSLDRDNPVDPHQGYIRIPPQVTNIFVIEQNNFVSISWDGIEDIDGFYLYRSMSYDGYYELLQDLENTVTLFEDTDVDIVNNFYWYKLSAYTTVGEDRLEGIRSEPHSW